MQSTIDKLKSGTHVTIVALGDSITANSLHNRGHMNWVSLLDEAILETYGWGVCTLINSGIPESTYASALKRLDRDVLRFEPDLVILALGMNDAFRGIAYLPEFKKEARQMIEIIKRKCGSDILIMTPNPIVQETGLAWSVDSQPGELFEGMAALADYSNALREVAIETNRPIVDHYSAWKNSVFSTDKLKSADIAYQYRLWPRMANSTHPGPLGHLAFYRELAGVFGLSKYFAWER